MSLPQLILIPGLLNDADLWRDQITPLSAVSRPQIADITQTTSLRSMAEAVLALAEDRFALAGFSLGGIVALEILRLVPERVSHLALLDTTMLPDTSNRLAEREKLVVLAQSEGRFHGFGEALLDTYFAAVNRNNAAMTDRVRGMTQRLGSEVFVRQSLVPRPDNRGLLPTVTCPTLVLCGEADKLTPPSIHRDMAIALPNSRLELVPDAGHMTPIEQPDRVTAALLALLRRPTC